MQHYRMQQDEQDGGWMTPAYSVETDPSMLYTAAPHNPRDRMRNWENMIYDRMDPQSARALHVLETGAPPTHVPSHETAPTADSERKEYTQSDVMAAFNSAEARPVYGMPAEMAQAAMINGCQIVSGHAQQEAALHAQNNASRAVLGVMRTELRNVRLCVDHILLDRSIRNKEEHRLARQNRRIMRQVSGQLRHIHRQMEVGQERVSKAAKDAERLQYQLQAVHVGLQMEAARAGLPDVDAVKAEAGEEFWRLLEDLGEEPATE